MGQARGGDHAGSQAGAVGQLQPGQQALGQAVGTVGPAAGADADRTHVGLHAGGDGGHGAGRIGRLRIGVVGLAECRGREALPGQQVLFTGATLLLALVDARGGHGGQAHAVAEEQDDVLGLAGHRTVGGGLGGATAVPPLRGLAGRVGDGATATLRLAGAVAGVVLAQAPSSRVVAQAANRETERRMDAGISQTVTGRSLCPPSQGTPMTH